MKVAEQTNNPSPKTCVTWRTGKQLIVRWGNMALFFIQNVLMSYPCLFFLSICYTNREMTSPDRVISRNVLPIIKFLNIEPGKNLENNGCTDMKAIIKKKKRMNLPAQTPSLRK